VVYVDFVVFFFQAEDGIRDRNVTGVQTCALPISLVGPQICRLRLAVSPQTGGCESDRDSALAEGRLGNEEQPGPDRQNREDLVNPVAWKSHEILPVAPAALTRRQDLGEPPLNRLARDRAWVD